MVPGGYLRCYLQGVLDGTWEVPWMVPVGCLRCYLGDVLDGTWEVSWMAPGGCLLSDGCVGGVPGRCLGSVFGGVCLGDLVLGSTMITDH